MDAVTGERKERGAEDEGENALDSGQGEARQADQQEDPAKREEDDAGGQGEGREPAAAETAQPRQATAPPRRRWLGWDLRRSGAVGVFGQMKPWGWGIDLLAFAARASAGLPSGRSRDRRATSLAEPA